MSEPRPAVAPVRPGSRRDRFAPFAWAISGGGLYCLGFVGYGVWPLVLVFLVPLWSALERARETRAPAPAVIGLVFGLAAYAGGFPWLWRLVDVFLDGNRLLGAALWLAYGAWFAAGFAVYAALFHRIRRRGWSVALAGIPPLLAIEWLQPQLFPVHAGSALVYATPWIQTADLGGPLLLSALVGLANGTIFETWACWRGRRPRPLAGWVAALAIALVAFAYGQVRLAGLEAAIGTAPALRVGVVQANLGLIEKRTQSLVSQRRHLEQTRELLADGGVDLVVWPETAYVRGLRRPLPISGQPILEDVAVPLLFGGTSVAEEDGRRRASNSAFLIGADGVIRDAYDKNLLIPLAEYPPLADLVPAIARWFPHLQEFSAATETPALRLGPWRIATPICYEAVRPDFVRRMVEEARPHLLVTLANDAWFGDSQEPWMHLALARLRAVEHRRFLVRSTNSGVSAVVDPGGRIIARTGLLTRETLRATVHMLDGRTVYDRFGDWPGWLAVAAVAVTLAIGAPPRRGGAG
ncbi:MAG: apolipoprotein N-acyltransferase [Candidatus Binatia bacterium]